VEDEANADFHRERALKEKANRQLREILVQQTRDQLHRACDIEAIQTFSNSEIRCRLLKFSKALASQLVGKEPAETKAIIDTEVRRLLNKLREFNPRDYYRRCKITELEAEQSQDEPQPKKEAVKKEQQSTGRVGWKKARPHPHFSPELRRKMSRAAKERWENMPLEERSAYLAKMQAARQPGYGKRAWAPRRQHRKSVSGAGS